MNISVDAEFLNILLNADKPAWLDPLLTIGALGLALVWASGEIENVAMIKNSWE